jgi:hypothetical protein
MSGASLTHPTSSGCFPAANSEGSTSALGRHATCFAADHASQKPTSNISRARVTRSCSSTSGGSDRGSAAARPPLPAMTRRRGSRGGPAGQPERPGCSPHVRCRAWGGRQAGPSELAIFGERQSVFLDMLGPGVDRLLAFVEPACAALLGDRGSQPTLARLRHVNIQGARILKERLRKGYVRRASWRGRSHGVTGAERGIGVVPRGMRIDNAQSSCPLEGTCSHARGSGYPGVRAGCRVRQVVPAGIRGLSVHRRAEPWHQLPRFEATHPFHTIRRPCDPVV